VYATFRVHIFYFPLTSQVQLPLLMMVQISWIRYLTGIIVLQLVVHTLCNPLVLLVAQVLFNAFLGVLVVAVLILTLVVWVEE